MTEPERPSIVCLSSQPWGDGMWTNKQHIMSRLARTHRVFYVNFGPKPLPQLLREKGALGARRWGPLKAALDPISEEQSGVTVLDFWGPRLLVRALGRAHPWSVAMTFDVRARLLARYLERQNVRDPILWVYHPGYGPAIAEIPHRLLVYDCVDEYSQFPQYREDARWLLEREEALCRAADLVFTTSEGLYQAKRRYNPERTHLVHNVGDFSHFSRARAPETEIPAELRELPRPIVGFVGAVTGYKIDIEWLLALARRHREYSLVLVGPVGQGAQATDLRELAAEPNVHLLGHRAYELLPGYLKGFDLTVIPYRINDYTTHVFPIKFFEFLATGRPVVVSALPALAAYADRVEVARDGEGFVRACEKALLDPEAGRSERIALAAENTWEHRVENLLSHVERALGSSRPAGAAE
ncbi:MAG TPA: glycosyltransferase [Polyangiaceae bacterium]